jgi:hypothetical protein
VIACRGQSLGGPLYLGFFFEHLDNKGMSRSRDLFSTNSRAVWRITRKS